jgi:hypothetical protein
MFKKLRKTMEESVSRSAQTILSAAVRGPTNAVRKLPWGSSGESGRVGPTDRVPIAAAVLIWLGIAND